MNNIKDQLRSNLKDRLANNIDDQLHYLVSDHIWYNAFHPRHWTNLSTSEAFIHEHILDQLNEDLTNRPNQ